MPTKRGLIISPMNVGDILLNTSSTIIGANALGKIIFATPTIKQLLGYEVKELIGQNLLIIIPDRFQKMHKSAFARWVDTGKLSIGGREMRLSALHKDGYEVQISMVLGSYYTEDGDLRAVATMKNIQDILDLEEKQRELEDELSYIQSITDNLSDSVVATDTTGCITFVNRAAINLLGYTQDDYLGKDVHNLYHKTKQDKSTLDKEDCLIHRFSNNEGEVSIYDDWVQKKDGSFVNVSITITPLKQGKKIIGYIEILHDITVEKQWTERLRESEKKYRELVELSPDPIAVHQDGKFVFANQACLDLMKANSFDEIKGMSILDFIHPDYHELVRSRMGRRMIIGQRLELAQEKGIDLRGNIIDIEVATMPILFDGRPSVLTIIRDIGIRLRLEEVDAYLAAIVDHAATPIIGKTLDGKIISWNRAAEINYGWMKEEAIGHHISIIVPPEKRAELDWIMKELRSARPIVDLKTTRVRKNNTKVNVSLHISPIKNKAGKLIGASSIATLVGK